MAEHLVQKRLAKEMVRCRLQETPGNPVRKDRSFARRWRGSGPIPCWKRTRKPARWHAGSFARRVLGRWGCLIRLTVPRSFQGVALASEPDGHPVMLVSSLSRHTQALRSDPRCSLLVGEPGKGDPLAHPRLSITGEARFLDRESQEHATARRRFLARHPKASLYADFADFSFVRIVMARASLNGGFARAYAMSESDLSLRGHPALEGLCEMEARAVAHMNEDHLDAVALYAEKLAGKEPGNWRMTSFDPEGMDLADGDRVARVPFDPPLQDASGLRPRLVALAKAARGEE